MKLKTLSSKLVYPLGIGTWGFGGGWEKETGNEQQCIEAIRYSVSKGQNLIDSAQIYGAGYTDEIIGQALTGLVREDLYLSDKLWETSVGKGKVKPAVDKMLSKFGTDYLDLLYIHKPWTDSPWREAMPQINNLIDEGIVKQFGVSNFNLAQLQETMQLSKHPIVANQLRYSISYREEVTGEMIKFCKRHNIQIIAYRPLERGELLENEQVQFVAKNKGVSAAQVSLAWLLNKGVIVLTKATHKKYIDSNVAAVDVKLSPKELVQLDEL